MVGANKMTGLNIEFVEDFSQTAEFAASLIIDMTSIQFKRAGCAEIEAMAKKGQRCFIYFGSVDDIQGGEMKHLNMVAAFDSYTNPTENIPFLYNDHPDCKRGLGFRMDEPAVAMC
jgi:hypothetical protein